MNSERPILKVMRELTPSVYVPSFLSSLAGGAKYLILPLYALEVTGSTAIAALVVGLSTAGTMAGNIPSGMLISRFGERTLMVAGLLIQLIATAILAFVDKGWLIVVLSFVMGLGTSAWILARQTYIAEHVSFAFRGRVISIMAGLARAGTLVGPVAAGFSVEIFGYSPVFIAVSLCFLLPIVLILIFIEKEPAHAVDREPVKIFPLLVEHRKILSTAGLSMIVVSFLRNGRRFMVPVWGVAIGMSASDIGLAVSLAAAVDFAMFLPVGFILDHVGRKATLIPCISLMGLSFLLLPLTDSFWPFVLVCMLAGLGNGFGTGIFMTLGADFSPNQGRSEFLGVWRFIGDSGGSIGPIVMGTIASAFTTGIACVFTGGLAGLGVLLALFLVPEPRKRVLDQKSAQPTTFTGTR